jgi:hypothetical protein
MRVIRRSIAEIFPWLHSLTLFLPSPRLFQSRAAAVNSEASSRGLRRRHNTRHLQSTIFGTSGGTGTASGTGSLDVGDMGGTGSSNIMSTFNSGGFSFGGLVGPDGAVMGQSAGGSSGTGGGVGTITDSMMMPAGITFNGSVTGSGLGTFGAISSPIDFSGFTTGPTGGFGGGIGALDLTSAGTGTGFGTDVNAVSNGMNFGSGGGQGNNIFGIAGGMGAGMGTGAAFGMGTTVDGVFSSMGTSTSNFNNLAQGFFGGPNPFTFGSP